MYRRQTVRVPSTTLSALVVQQVGKIPDAPALADVRHQFDYREMRQQVVALASLLRVRGVKPSDSVAAALPRSMLLTLALYGTVEAGTAWLSLGTGYPDDRLWMVLEDVEPELLVAANEQLMRFSDIPGLESLCHDSPLPAKDTAPLALFQSDYTAYIIFTSGSIGRPKGVIVGRTAIVNHLLWVQDHYSLIASNVVTQKTPCSFNVSVREFFQPFIAETKPVMAKLGAHRDPLAMQQLFVQYGVTTIHSVPSASVAFVASLMSGTAWEDCVSLKWVFCSGEALPADLYHEREQLTHVPLHNLCGPTGVTVDANWYPAQGEDLAAIAGNSVSTSYSAQNTSLHVLDATMRPMPFSMAGDLYLTGIQLAQGYLGRPDLTTSRFIADPFNVSERMYHTGNVARWLENGAMEYLERSDDQLKIHGQHIELSEIDRVIQQLPDVEHAVAHVCVFNQAATTDGDTRQLVGYLVLQPGLSLDTSALREKLREKLPAHMVPMVLLQLAELPLSANGKLNRKALLTSQLTPRTSGCAPRAGTEVTIAQSFAALPGHEVNDVMVDFFTPGGHSLLVMELAVQLSRVFERQVTPGQIMVVSIIEQLSALLESTNDKQPQRIGSGTLLPLRRSHGPTLFCFHPASGLV